MTDQQGSELVPVERELTDSWVDVVGPIFELAQQIARTQFVPASFRNNAPAVAAAMLTGRELSLGPMTALRGLDAIDGSVSMSAHMMGARILAAGHRIEWVSSTDKACEVKITRRDGLSEAAFKYTLADAQRAGLAGKKNWRQDPVAMLRARALSNAARMACPDVILGLDIPPEADTGPSTPSTRVEVATPTPPPETAPERPTQAANPTQDVDRPEPSTSSGRVGLVTDAQLRKLNAQLGELSKLRDASWTKDERRWLILKAADLDQDSVTSAKELTKDQASAAIETLTVWITESLDPPTNTDSDQDEVVEAVIVDDQADA